MAKLTADGDFVIENSSAQWNVDADWQYQDDSLTVL
jgi:hypothetical protein